VLESLFEAKTKDVSFMLEPSDFCKLEQRNRVDIESASSRTIEEIQRERTTYIHSSKQNG